MAYFTKLVLKRPVSVLIIIFGLLVFGFMAITNLPLELTPELEMPMHIIVTVFPGAAPEDVEKLVTRPVEGSAGSLSGVKTITSQTMENVSIVILQYNYGTNMDIAYTDLKDSIDLIERNLPDDAQKPTVIELDINAESTLSLSVTSDTWGDDLGFYIEDEIVPEFEKLATVADVGVSGGRSNYIKVEISEQSLQQYGVSLQTLAACISTANFSIPSGTIDYGSQSLTVRSAVEMNTVEALNNISIPLMSGDVIRLSDVANVYTTWENTSRISRFNGLPNVSMSLQKRQSVSAVQMSREAMKVVDELNAADNGINIKVISDSSETILSSISSVAYSLLLGIVISMAILFIFLGDYKASLIVGSSMPVSLLVTFILMDMMGFTLNVVTMGGLVLGVGMMVDNSIVVLDSCFKTKTSHNTLFEAALEGSRFVMLSIMAGTLTTVVVFFPLATIQGMSGQLFTPLGFTIIFSLTASLVSAITLVPLFFVQFAPQEKRTAPAAMLLKKVEHAYGRLLKKMLRRKFIVFISTIVLLVVSVMLASQINSELIPSVDEGAVSVYVNFRPGLRVERIDEIMLEIEEIVAVNADLDRYSVSSGGGGMAALSGGTTANLYAYLKKNRVMSTQQVVDELRLKTAHITDCTIDVSGSNTVNMGAMDTVDVMIMSSNLDSLTDFSDEIVAIMEAHPDIIRVSSNMEGGSPQLEVSVNPMKAAAFGLTPIQSAQSISTALGGMDTVSITMGDKRYDIRIEYPDGKYKTVADLEDLVIVSPAGLMVPLTDIADFKFSSSPQAIYREDNQYVISITGTPRSGTRFTAYNEIMASVNSLDFPRGVDFYESSMMAMMNEEFASIGRAILIAIILVFMVMAIQFESIKYSLMVMLTMPFSLIGSFLLLYISDSTLSMPSLLGFLVLVGTVVNNGILFVDTANQYRQTMDVEQALVRTGRTRLRPILMTTLTTVLSMLPMGLAIGDGTQIMQGMALVVIGGLTAATFLPLLFLPTFYLIMDGIGKNRKRRLKPISVDGEDKRPRIHDPEPDTDPVTV